MGPELDLLENGGESAPKGKESEEGVVCGRVNKGGERKLCNWKKIYKEGEIGGAKHGRTIRFFPIPSFSQKNKKI